MNQKQEEIFDAAIRIVCAHVQTNTKDTNGQISLKAYTIANALRNAVEIENKEEGGGDG